MDTRQRFDLIVMRCIGLTRLMTAVLLFVCAAFLAGCQSKSDSMDKFVENIKKNNVDAAFSSLVYDKKLPQQVINDLKVIISKSLKKMGNVSGYEKGKANVKFTLSGLYKTEEHIFKADNNLASVSITTCAVFYLSSPKVVAMNFDSSVMYTVVSEESEVASVVRAAKDFLAAAKQGYATAKEHMGEEMFAESGELGVRALILAFSKTDMGLDGMNVTVMTYDPEVVTGREGMYGVVAKKQSGKSSEYIDIVLKKNAATGQFKVSGFKFWFQERYV